MTFMAGNTWHNEMGRRFSNTGTSTSGTCLRGTRSNLHECCLSGGKNVRHRNLGISQIFCFFIWHFKAKLFLYSLVTLQHRTLKRSLRAWKHSLIPWREQRGPTFNLGSLPFVLDLSDSSQVGRTGRRPLHTPVQMCMCEYTCTCTHMLLWGPWSQPQVYTLNYTLLTADSLGADVWGRRCSCP